MENCYWSMFRLAIDNNNDREEYQLIQGSIVLQAILPWKFFVGWSSSNEMILANVIDDNILNSGRTHAFRSGSDIVLTMIGPPNPNLVANMHFCVQGVMPECFRLVVGIRPGQQAIFQPQSLGESYGFWGKSIVSISEDWPVQLENARRGPPLPGYIGPWMGIEVHTNLKGETLGGLPHVTQRIEHHSPARVPPPNSWPATSHGGYGTANMEQLQCQAQAAHAYQFAMKTILKFTNWAQLLNGRFPRGFIKLMGFETNNPLHDDHTGLGAHWHVAFHSNQFNIVPHLYLNEDGTHDSQKDGHIGYNLKAFAITYNPIQDSLLRSYLELGPIVEISTQDGYWLHVRQSKQEDFDEVVSFDNPDNSGNHWMWIWIDKERGRFALRSVRSWKYLHVRYLRQQVDDPILQYFKCDEGSIWVLQRDNINGDLFMVNERSGHPLAMIPALRGVAVQSQQYQQQRSRLTITQWRNPIQPDDLSSFALKMLHVQPGRARVQIEKDSREWMQVEVSDDSKHGQLKVHESDGIQTATYEYHYEPLTGQLI